MESKTLRSHRVIGEVADGTPQTCAFYDLGGVGYCAVRVGGDAFQVMALDGLTVQSASPRLGRNIRAIGAQGEWTYCAIDDEVWCFLRARFVGLAAGAPAAVDRFETVGGLLLGAGAGFVQGWARGDEGAAARRRVPDKVLCFDVDLAGVVLCHPPTYVNKVLLGARDGRLELWNVRSGKRVHAYASIARGPGIAHVAASGALDVVAVARGTGRIQLLDARRDAVLFELDHGAAAATCCFCRGGEPRGAGDARPPVLVAAGGDQLRVWDLETRALLHVEKRVGGVAALHAGGLAGGPTGADAVVVTSVGADAKQWALDASDGAPRLCRRRDGLGGAPAVVRWYGSRKASIGQNLSAGGSQQPQE